MEDTDEQRSTGESEADVLRDLKWLGLDWDEGTSPCMSVGIVQDGAAWLDAHWSDDCGGCRQIMECLAAFKLGKYS